MLGRLAIVAEFRDNDMGQHASRVGGTDGPVLGVVIRSGWRAMRSPCLDESCPSPMPLMC